MVSLLCVGAIRPPTPTKIPPAMSPVIILAVTMLPEIASAIIAASTPQINEAGKTAIQRSTFTDRSSIDRMPDCNLAIFDQHAETFQHVVPSSMPDLNRQDLQ